MPPVGTSTLCTPALPIPPLRHTLELLSHDHSRLLHRSIIAEDQRSNRLELLRPDLERTHYVVRAFGGADEADPAVGNVTQ